VRRADEVDGLRLCSASRAAWVKEDACSEWTTGEDVVGWMYNEAATGKFAGVR
jgi:hypothetical protein